MKMKGRKSEDIKKRSLNPIRGLKILQMDDPDIFTFKEKCRKNVVSFKVNLKRPLKSSEASTSRNQQMDDPEIASFKEKCRKNVSSFEVNCGRSLKPSMMSTPRNYEEERAKTEMLKARCLNNPPTVILSRLTKFFINSHSSYFHETKQEDPYISMLLKPYDVRYNYDVIFDDIKKLGSSALNLSFNELKEKLTLSPYHDVENTDMKIKKAIEDLRSVSGGACIMEIPKEPGKQINEEIEDFDFECVFIEDTSSDEISSSISQSNELANPVQTGIKTVNKEKDHSECDNSTSAAFSTMKLMGSPSAAQHEQPCQQGDDPETLLLKEKCIKNLSSFTINLEFPLMS